MDLIRKLAVVTPDGKFSTWGGVYLEAMSCKIQYRASYSCLLCGSLKWLKVLELNLDDRPLDRIKYAAAHDCRISWILLNVNFAFEI